MAKIVSCGVIVTDRRVVLLGHATRSPRWDIPKGIAQSAEDGAAAAVRELKEETGLVVPAESLHELGVFTYLPGKDLRLFAWEPPKMPAPENLHCRSTFELRNGSVLPEFDRFGLFVWSEALEKVGRNMARALAEVRQLLSRP